MTYLSWQYKSVCTSSGSGDKIEDYIEILVNYPDKVVQAIEEAETEVQDNEVWTYMEKLKIAEKVAFAARDTKKCG